MRRQERLRTRYGPWAVVTGASSGIGREMALVLAEAGFELVLVARSKATLEQLAANLAKRYGVEARAVACDLAHGAGIGAIESATRDLDVGLFVAAADFGTSGPFLEASIEIELEMLDINCRAVFEMSQRLGPRPDPQWLRRPRRHAHGYGSRSQRRGTPDPRCPGPQVHHGAAWDFDKTAHVLARPVAAPGAGPDHG